MPAKTHKAHIVEATKWTTIETSIWSGFAISIFRPSPWHRRVVVHGGIVAVPSRRERQKFRSDSRSSGTAKTVSSGCDAVAGREEEGVKPTTDDSDV